MVAPQPSWARALAAAAALATAGTVAGLVVNALRPDGLHPNAFAAPTTCAAPAAAPITRVAPAAAAALCGVPHSIIADARSPERFAEGHIAGAVHLPCSASGFAAQTALAQFGDKASVLVYGDTTDEGLAVAESLRRQVAPDLRISVLEGGFSAWSGAGLACTSGACASCEASSTPHHESAR